MSLSCSSEPQLYLHSGRGKYLNFKPVYLFRTPVNLSVWAQTILNPQPQPSDTRQVKTCELTKHAQADEGDRGYAPDDERDLLLSSFLSSKGSRFLCSMLQSQTSLKGSLHQWKTKTLHLRTWISRQLRPISSVSIAWLYDNKPGLCTWTRQQRSEGNIFRPSTRNVKMIWERTEV